MKRPGKAGAGRGAEFVKGRTAIGITPGFQEGPTRRFTSARVCSEIAHTPPQFRSARTDRRMSHAAGGLGRRLGARAVQRDDLPLKQEGGRLGGEEPSQAAAVLEDHGPPSSSTVPGDDLPAPPTRGALHDQAGFPSHSWDHRCAVVAASG